MNFDHKEQLMERMAKHCYRRRTTLVAASCMDGTVCATDLAQMLILAAPHDIVISVERSNVKVTGTKNVKVSFALARIDPESFVHRPK